MIGSDRGLLWPRAPRTLGQIVLIERLPDQSFDDGLAAHVEVLSGLVQFFQHAARDVYIHSLQGLHHATLAFEKTGDVFTLIGQPGDRIGRNRRNRFMSFLHTTGPNL